MCRRNMAGVKEPPYGVTTGGYPYDSEWDDRGEITHTPHRRGRPPCLPVGITERWNRRRG